MSRRRARFNRWELGAQELAKALLGQVLVRVERGRRAAGRIVETEAYLGGADLGSHTAGGRRTPRTESMYLPGGHAYIYFTYGMHWCFNAVAGPAERGCAALVRAIEPLEGMEVMARRREVSKAQLRHALDSGDRERLARLRLASGPARLCQALAISGALDGENLVSSSRLFIERGAAVPASKRRVTPRVGIDYAGEWAGAPLRFMERGNPFVSRP